MAMRYTPEDWGAIRGQKVQEEASKVWKQIQALAGPKSSSPKEAGGIPDWLQMRMDAIDAKGGGGGGGGGGFYSVPSIDPQIQNLRNFQATGNQNIQGAYANLNDIYAKSQAATEKTGADTTAAVTKTFDDNAATQAQLLSQMQGSAQQENSYGGTAGTAATNAVMQAAQARIASNQSDIAARKASTMANQQQYAQGMADAARQAHTVSGVDQANVTGNFNTNISNQLAQLQSQYEAELSKANAANASSRASSSSSGSNAQSEKLKVLSDYLKGQDKDAKTAAAKMKGQKDPKKGMAAVIAAAKKAGKPELANTFAGLLSAAQTQSSTGIDITDPKTGAVTGTKPISLNNALKQILDMYASKTAPMPTNEDMYSNGKMVMPQRFGVPKGTPSKGVPGLPDLKPVKKDHVYDLLGGVGRMTKKMVENQKAQRVQDQLNQLYNFYTGQYGG